MKRIIWCFLLIFVLAGCEGSPTPLSTSPSSPTSSPSSPFIGMPPAPAKMGIGGQNYSYEGVAGLSSSYLKTIQVPSRIEALDGSKKPVRIAVLKSFDATNRVLTFEIQYPGYALESVAKFRYSTYRAILEEVFSKKWLIKYEYSQEFAEKFGIPASYTVYAYSAGTDAYDQLIGTFTLSKKGAGVLTFKDSKGVEIQRDTLYFVVLPDER